MMKAGCAVFALENALCRNTQTPAVAWPMPSDVHDATNTNHPVLFHSKKVAAHGSILSRFVTLLAALKLESAITVHLLRAWRPARWHG
jgi:hypothetical protein